MSRSLAPPGGNDLRLSLTLAYDLWLASWETALSALATAARSRAVSANEVTAHMMVIKTERELVTRQFMLLLGEAMPRGSVNGDGSIARAEEWLHAR